MLSNGPKDRQRAKIKESAAGTIGVALDNLFVGISAFLNDAHSAVVAIAFHDSIYLHDFNIKQLGLKCTSTNSDCIITEYVVQELRTYEHKNFVKFVGAGIPGNLLKVAPQLSSRICAALEIVPITLRCREEPNMKPKSDSYWDRKSADEQADSMARKCVCFLGPRLSPLLQVGSKGLVEVDASNHIIMCALDDYRASCGLPTWNLTMKFASHLQENKTKIPFFRSTPQGGGVALMRHALVRFARVAEVDLRWYVPKPSPGVFRITKNIHNI